MKPICKLLLVLGALSLTIALVMTFNGSLPQAGYCYILFLLSLAIGAREFEATKGISFTLLIFSAVVAAMFYPAPFVSIGGFQLKYLIVPLIQIIMFGMGSQMSMEDFTGVIRMPKGVIVGVGAHYIIMPLIAFGISNIFDFPPEVKAGIILIGCVPSGLASNVMSYIANANLALAVTVGAISTLLSPFVTPFLMKWLGGQYIEVHFWHMMFDILNMIILPIVAGFIFNLFAGGTAKRRGIAVQMSVYFIIIVLTNLVSHQDRTPNGSTFLTALSTLLFYFYVLPFAGALAVRYFSKDHSLWLPKALSLISMAGIAFIVTIIVASGRDSLLKVGALLVITSLLHNLAGYALGYGVSWMCGMPEKDRRTVAFEVGMQNGGLASGLALQMGKVTTVGLAPAIFGPLMNMTGAALAAFWRNRKTD